MPEGHTIHRLAEDLDKLFTGHKLHLSSPQGRFELAAKSLDGQPLKKTEAHGKHLFLGFPGDRWIHIHLGIIGSFRRGALPLPPVAGVIRLRLVSNTAYADLRGPQTCELITGFEKYGIHMRLGPDPLRADADPDLAWQRISKSKRSIAELLMDQKVLAGVGNVYRAEVLFRQNLDPDTPGHTLDKGTWDAIWSDTVLLMREGVRLNRIDTVRPEHTPEAMGRPPRKDDHGGEVYVYRRTAMPCLICGTDVRTKELVGRNLFWCPTCQKPVS